MLVDIAYLPTSTQSLKNWLLNFIEHIQEVALLLGIPENQTKRLCRKLDLVINDLKKKEFGMYHDQVLANHNQYETLTELNTFVSRLKNKPGFHLEVHGSLLWLDRRYNEGK